MGMTEPQKEHPLLFRPEMARAVVAGKKTHTRRLMTRTNSLVDGHQASQELWDALDFSRARIDAGPSPGGWPGPYLIVPHRTEGSQHRIYPRIQAGDAIWGKETRASHNHFARPATMGPQHNAGAQRIWSYAADEVDVATITQKHPSIHMPRAFARIVADVLASRPERLQDISEADAIAEGISRDNVIIGADAAGGAHREITATRFFYDGCDEEGFESGAEAYADLWDSINGAGGPGSWEDNPLVWVYAFKPREISGRTAPSASTAAAATTS